MFREAGLQPEPETEVINLEGQEESEQQEEEPSEDAWSESSLESFSSSSEAWGPWTDPSDKKEKRRKNRCRLSAKDKKVFREYVQQYAAGQQNIVPTNSHICQNLEQS